jgi:hypothetical protein
VALARLFFKLLEKKERIPLASNTILVHYYFVTNPDPLKIPGVSPFLFSGKCPPNYSFL